MQKAAEVYLLLYNAFYCTTVKERRQKQVAICVRMADAIARASKLPKSIQ